MVNTAYKLKTALMVACWTQLQEDVSVPWAGGEISVMKNVLKISMDQTVSFPVSV